MDHQFIDDQETPRHERELTLSTGSILAIFLGLAVLCGGFFAFGYTMGRKSAPTPLNLADVATESTLPASGAPKPSAGSPLDSTVAPSVAVTTKTPHRPAPAQPVVEDDGSSPAAQTAPVKRSESTAPSPAPIVRTPAPTAPAVAAPTAAATSGGTFMVQVAAVSHQDDADLLLGALRARGYAVSARPSAADNFIHVQIGPFHDKKEADAMRQRLLTDGYNAIVKQ